MKLYRLLFKRKIVFSQSDEQGLLLCWHLCSSSPELKPNKITDDEVKNKSRIELRLTEPLLIANKKLRIYSSASIAANPMLAVSAFVYVINNM